MDRERNDRGRVGDKKGKIRWDNATTGTMKEQDECDL